MIPSSSSGIAAVGLVFNGFWHQDSSTHLDNQHCVRWGVALPKKSVAHSYEWAAALFLFVHRKTTTTVLENGTLAPLVPPMIVELLSFTDGNVSQGFRLMRGCFAQEECSEQLQVRRCSVSVCRQRDDDNGA
uniref:Uncharacterized protein n=1 Tax=Nelumbo nucifera TaxID=4432 RepID=A0A822Y5V4_NELNU|nr:TPA_asm: hypothetical protein HUJ06_028177 [Nelumbo nucifera]